MMLSGEWGKMGSKSDKVASIPDDLNEAVHNGPYTIDQCCNKLNSMRAKCKKVLAKVARRRKLYKTTGAETGELTEDAEEALKVLPGFLWGGGGILLGNKCSAQPATLLVKHVWTRIYMWKGNFLPWLSCLLPIYIQGSQPLPPTMPPQAEWSLFEVYWQYHSKDPSLQIESETAGFGADAGQAEPSSVAKSSKPKGKGKGKAAAAVEMQGACGQGQEKWPCKQQGRWE
jgi:hypothetical protein